MIYFVRNIIVATLLFVGFTNSSFAGLTELFDFEDQNGRECYNMRHGGSDFPPDQKDARREAIRSLTQPMFPEEANVFADQILAIERRGLFYLDIEQISLFAKKSPQDRGNIVKHVDHRVRNYMVQASRRSDAPCVFLEDREKFHVKGEILEGWDSFLFPLLHSTQMTDKGPEAECLDRVFGRKNRYALSLVRALENIPRDQQEEVVCQVLRLESTVPSLDFGPNFIHLHPFVEVLAPLSCGEREDLITHTRKISNRYDDRDLHRNLALDLTVLTFLSRIDPSERDSLMKVICSFADGIFLNKASYDNDMFDDIFGDIHSKSLGCLWHQQSLHWENEDELREPVRHAQALLMELRHLNLTPMGYAHTGHFAKAIAKIKYASSPDEEWFREGHRPDHGFVYEADASWVEHRDRYKSLSEIDRERIYSRAARDAQKAIFTRIFEVFPENPHQQNRIMEYFIETAMTRQTQGRCLDLFLPTMTPLQRDQILEDMHHEYFPTYTSDTLEWMYANINRAWRETRDVVAPDERLRIVNRVFHPDHEELQAQGVADRENVMNTRRIARSKVALDALYTKLTPGFDLQRQYPDIVHILETYIRGLAPTDKTLSTDPLFYGKRAGNTEIGHALFVLNGVKKEARGDYDSLAENYLYTHSDSGQPYRMLGIMGRVWHLIMTHQNEAERLNMLHSFVMALGQSFDEDGGKGPHRVCNVGKVQRLLSVLQGHFPGIEIDEVEAIPAIETVLTTLTADLFNSEDNSPKVTLEQARVLIVETAERVYGRNEEQKVAFLSQAENFLDALEPQVPPLEEGAAAETSDQKKERIKNNAVRVIQRAFRKHQAYLIQAKPKSLEDRRAAALAAVTKRNLAGK